ncbi:hypothetical protein TcasGA2_TC006898 [Tribolium castaneum]|uniref:Uncharacterized protein n=1 Tax=Tribolium castaneum TaxID=7070 RepID=D7GY20_TRICA|nr:hypothetical protein TcasGA2_TC006898 [Tribolium castaneum]
MILQEQLTKSVKEGKSFEEEITRLKKVQAEAVIQEKEFEEMAVAFKRTERELSQRNSQTKLNLKKEQRSFQNKLNEVEDLVASYENKSANLSRELQTKQRILDPHDQHDDLYADNEVLGQNKICVVKRVCGNLGFINYSIQNNSEIMKQESQAKMGLLEETSHTVKAKMLNGDGVPPENNQDQNRAKQSQLLLGTVTVALQLIPTFEAEDSIKTFLGYVEDVALLEHLGDMQKAKITRIKPQGVARRMVEWNEDLHDPQCTWQKLKTALLNRFEKKLPLVEPIKQRVLSAKPVECEEAVNAAIREEQIEARIKKQTLQQAITNKDNDDKSIEMKQELPRFKKNYRSNVTNDAQQQRGEVKCYRCRR